MSTSLRQKLARDPAWGEAEIRRLTASLSKAVEALENIESYNQECRDVSCSYTSAMVIGALEGVMK